MKSSNIEAGPSPSAGEQPLRWWNSLYVKLAVTFMLIIAAVGGTHLYITSVMYRPLVAHIEQQIHWDLAANLAERIQPITAHGFEKERVEQELFHYWFMNPKVEAYVLDQHGNILAEVAPHAGRRKVDRVPLGPIQKALKTTAPTVPIFGRDPRSMRSSSNGPNRAISVAPLRLGDQQGYLYIVLEAATFRFLTRATGQFYIVTTVLIGMLVITILAALVGFVVFRYLTRNFRALTIAVREYRDGKFDLRIPVSTDDEVGRLSSAVNQMIETISRQTQELQDNDRLRRELIANISHDLRSPLTAMQGFLETLHRKGATVTSSERDKYLSLIFESVRLQRQLVDDLFELSKLEAKERSPELEEAHLGEIAQDVLIKHKALAEEKDIDLTLEVMPGCPFVLADIVLIDRVVSNLLSNALRYTPNGGAVTVSVRRYAECCELRVADTGPGIPSEELPYIFDSFYRVHKDRNRKTGGSGLGLAIVRRILELHEAEVQVESREGEGTAFWFRLSANLQKAHALETEGLAA